MNESLGPPLVLDVEEAKKQVLFSLPMIFTNLFYYLITLVSVMFAGHLGKLELAGATLANSWAIVTGFAFMAQFVVLPLVFSFVPLVIHFGIAYGLVHWTALGYKGAPLAASISLWLSVLLLAMYVICSKKFENTWEGFSLESFHYVLTDLKLALPSALMVCLEEWAFEILVFMGGLMPNSEETTSLMAICVNTEALAYMIIYGLSAAASTRVSNELGAGNPDKAKKAMAMTLKLSMLLALVLVLALAVGHNIWAGFFSDSHIIAEQFASMVPLLVISIIVDSVQGVLSGVARGCGWQHLTVYVNIVTFYMIGMTISSLLGFKFKLHAKRIPPKFVKNFNVRPLHKCALSGPSGIRWTVELEERGNGLFFQDGWQGFVKDHHLEDGDFLVFKYDGESKFKVTIYDRTACEKDVKSIPKEVAVTEGLLSKKSMMIQDPTGRSWPVKLRVRGKLSSCRVVMSTGLVDCCNANQIIPGDTAIFEFVKPSLAQIHIFRVGGNSVVLAAPDVKD
ncbi:hypothetical protein ACE6H2_014522 [Prunus campanulata]